MTSTSGVTPRLGRHVYRSIICIGVLVASDRGSHWDVEALGAPHVGDRTERELISTFVNRIDEFDCVKTMEGPMLTAPKKRKLPLEAIVPRSDPNPMVHPVSAVRLVPLSALER
jgi:hypothetical protein